MPSWTWSTPRRSGGVRRGRLRGRSAGAGRGPSGSNVLIATRTDCAACRRRRSPPPDAPSRTCSAQPPRPRRPRAAPSRRRTRRRRSGRRHRSRRPPSRRRPSTSKPHTTLLIATHRRGSIHPHPSIDHRWASLRKEDTDRPLPSVHLILAPTVRTRRMGVSRRLLLRSGSLSNSIGVSIPREAVAAVPVVSVVNPLPRPEARRLRTCEPFRFSSLRQRRPRSPHRPRRRRRWAARVRRAGVRRCRPARTRTMSHLRPTAASGTPNRPLLARMARPEDGAVAARAARRRIGPSRRDRRARWRAVDHRRGA